MTDISRHPLIRQAYDVTVAIEACGASRELTEAVTKAGDLMRAIDQFIPASDAPDSDAQTPAERSFPDALRGNAAFLRDCYRDLGEAEAGVVVKALTDAAARIEALESDASDASDALAGKLIDVWIADKSKGSGKISWAKAVQITAIVTKQTDGERDRLLRLGDEDGSCEMCGRSGP